MRDGNDVAGLVEKRAPNGIRVGASRALTIKRQILETIAHEDQNRGQSGDEEALEGRAHAVRVDGQLARQVAVKLISRAVFLGDRRKISSVGIRVRGRIVQIRSAE